MNGKSLYEYVAAVKIVRQGFILNTPGADDLIALHQAKDGEETGSSGGILHYGFQLEDKAQLDNAIEQVIAAGGSLKKRGDFGPDLPFAYVRDPDGYEIEL